MENKETQIRVDIKNGFYPKLPGKIIFDCIVGSTLHGVNVNDGLEDLDITGVMIEDARNKIGFGHQDIFTWRSKPEGVRSEAGDVDFVLYGLEKYLSLVLRGNPTLLLLFFAPDSFVNTQTKEGYELRKLRGQIISSLCLAPFLGYLKKQKERMIGTRGQKNVTRPELVEKYGYDTKFAGHAVRLGLQGKELLSTGKLTLPMKDEERRLVLDIRTGKYSEGAVVEMIEKVEDELKIAYDNSPLPSAPNYVEIERFMIQSYLNHWGNMG